MATTIAEFYPGDAEFPASGATPAPANFSYVHATDRRPVVEFDAATDEQCYWTRIAPQGLPASTLTLLVAAIVQATTGDVVLAAQIEAITDGDALDLDTGNDFDTVNSASAEAVPGTAGQLKVYSVTLTNKDSILPGDLYRVRLMRDADNASDTAAGLLQVLAAELRAA